MSERGTGMATDIAEQPEVFAGLWTGRTGEIEQVARVIAEHRPKHVVFTARGTSDHAALYAAYLTEIRLGGRPRWPRRSAMTLYGARPELATRWSSGCRRAAVRPT